MLPASTNTSPALRPSSLSKRLSIFFLEISGPAPLISVPSIDFNLRLILDIPLSAFIKSALTPALSSLLLISSPVNPAINP